jgi:pSer/pThr/pTyr-binding forkhead associated (FHA) protein
VADVFCNNCGHRNPEDANFCSSCGAVLESTTSDPTTITFFPVEPSDQLAGEAESGAGAGAGIPGDAGDVATLVALSGPGAGSRYGLDRVVTTLGRHPESDIFLDDITVSRRHAEVEHAADGYRVRDIGSLNGTYVNRQRVDDVLLADGDELQVGRFKLRFLDASNPGGS